MWEILETYLRIDPILIDFLGLVSAWKREGGLEYPDSKVSSLVLKLSI